MSSTSILAFCCQKSWRLLHQLRELDQVLHRAWIPILWGTFAAASHDENHPIPQIPSPRQNTHKLEMCSASPHSPQSTLPSSSPSHNTIRTSYSKGKKNHTYDISPTTVKLISSPTPISLNHGNARQNTDRHLPPPGRLGNSRSNNKRLISGFLGIKTSSFLPSIRFRWKPRSMISVYSALRASCKAIDLENFSTTRVASRVRRSSSTLVSLVVRLSLFCAIFPLNCSIFLTLRLSLKIFYLSSPLSFPYNSSIFPILRLSLKVLYLSNPSSFPYNSSIFLLLHLSLWTPYLSTPPSFP